MVQPAASLRPGEFPTQSELVLPSVSRAALGLTKLEISAIMVCKGKHTYVFSRMPLRPDGGNVLTWSTNFHEPLDGHWHQSRYLWMHHSLGLLLNTLTTVTMVSDP